MIKTFKYYLSLPYTRELIPDPTGVWFIRIKELPGCMSQGSTPEEAIRMIDDAMRGWLEVSIEDGDPIPEPRPDEEFSGKFVVRVPKSLHRKLVEIADGEEISLNQYINVTLSSAVGENRSKLHSEKIDALINTLANMQMDMRQFMALTEEKIHVKTLGSDDISLDSTSQSDLQKQFIAMSIYKPESVKRQK
jgi:antitoxin HicB